MRRRRRRYFRNPSAASKIGWAIALTALTTATGALVLWYVNRKLPKEEEKPKPGIDVSVRGTLPDYWRTV